MEDPPCVFCRQPVRTITVSGHGTQWVHYDGYAECRPTYAAPDLIQYGTPSRKITRGE